MYLATVDWATSMPSLSNSPWIRGAPHNQFARLISRIRSRISRGIGGRPPLDRDFQRQKALNPRRCQRISVSGLMIAIASTTFGQSRQSQTNASRSALDSRRCLDARAAVCSPDGGEPDSQLGAGGAISPATSTNEAAIRPFQAWSRMMTRFASSAGISRRMGFLVATGVYGNYAIKCSLSLARLKLF